MNIGRFSIKYRYFVLALAIAIVLFGLYSKMTLKSQLAPDTNAPAVTVLAQYPGASAQDVVKDVTKPMEDAFGTLDGIAGIKSTSQDNVASIRLDFNYGVSVDQAAIDVQNTISRIKDQLPSSLKEPKVLKFSTSDKPVATVSLTSSTKDLREIRQLAEERIGFELQLVEGVAAVNHFGGNGTEVKIELDRNRMEAYGLTLDGVNQALLQNNIKAPGGKITDSGREVLVRVEDAFEDLGDLAGLRIPLEGGSMAYLGDIATIELGTEELESAYQFNGKDAIALMVTKKSDANTVDVVENIKDAMKDLESQYPYIDFELAQDDSVFTVQMIGNMTSSVLLALVFTMFIIILFISSIRQSLVISVSMPLVFMSTLGLMKLFGMKLDMVTLSALILSIGFVVDGAIVVVENIMTHYHDKKQSIMDAAVDGTNEIALPSIAGVTTTLIVLFPLLFIQGFVSEMFRPLALTVIFAISSSIVIALIIIPLFTVLMNRFKFRRTEAFARRLTVPFNRLMDKLLDLYVVLLRKSLKRKLAMFAILLLMMGGAGAFMARNGLEMLPKFDGGTTFVSIEMEPGTKLGDTLETVGYIRDYLDKQENVLSYDAQVGYEKDSTMLSDFGIMGTNQALLTVNLTPRTDREETIWEFQEGLREEISRIPDIKRFVVKEKGGTATSSSSAPIDVRITGDDQAILYSIASDLQREIEAIEGTTNIYKSFNMDNQQVAVRMDDARMQQLGLSDALVAKQLYEGIEGISAMSMDVGAIENVDVLLAYEEQFRTDLGSLMDVRIASPSGARVPLREVADIEIGSRANLITRENLEYTIDILGYTGDRAYSHITKDMQKAIDAYTLPEGYTAQMTGESADMGDSMKDMVFLLAMAVIFVYLVLVPQFKSFIYPVAIMASIPLVVIGIAPALGLTGKYISMPVMLGFILLAGTVVNNAILVIDRSLANLNRGLDLEEAVVEAVKARYRPIMMTALSDVVGMLPLALQLALGSERFSPLAITIIGGILSATFLTMIVIPVIFVSFEKMRRKVFAA